jgi:hypothetical protein
MHSSFQYRYMLLAPHTPTNCTFPFSTVTFCSPLTFPHNAHFHSVPLHVAHPSLSPTMHSSIQYRYMLLTPHTPPLCTVPISNVIFCSPQTLPHNTQFHSVPLGVAHPSLTHNTQFNSVTLHYAHHSHSPTIHSYI